MGSTLLHSRIHTKQENNEMRMQVVMHRRLGFCGATEQHPFGDVGVIGSTSRHGADECLSLEQPVMESAVAAHLRLTAQPEKRAFSLHTLTDENSKLITAYLQVIPNQHPIHQQRYAKQPTSSLRHRVMDAPEAKQRVGHIPPDDVHQPYIKIKSAP